MHTFVVVCARPGRSLPPWLVAALDEAAPAELTFRPDEHVHWRDRPGTLHFAGWQAGAEHLGVGSRWHVDHRGVTAFTGHTWLDTTPWATGRSWAEQLADRVATDGVPAIARRLDGVFNLVSLAPTGEGWVTGDPLGIGLTYHGRSDDAVVWSNRAALVARLITSPGRSPARDVEGALILAYANNLQTERTTFVGVSPLPRASMVRVAPRVEPDTRQWSPLPWIDPGLAGIPESPELFAPAVDHLRGLVRVMAALPSRMKTLELTGGRDSRMILGLLLAEGVADTHTCITWGSPDLPDVVTAGILADRFRLDLRAQGRPPRPRLPAHDRRDGGGPGIERPDPPRPDPLPFVDEIRRHVWRTSGAVSIWDTANHGRTPSPNLALTGQFGELLRTNYPRTTGVASLADLDAFVQAGGFGFDAARLLRPRVRRRLDGQVIDLLHDLRPAGGTAQDAVDGFNQVARLRRWFGTSNELDNRNRLFPLYSMTATQVAFAIGSRRRHLEALPLAVLQATCPELATIAFAPSSWPASLVAGRPDRDRYPTSPDAPPWVPPPTPRRLGRRLTRRHPRPRAGAGRPATPKLAAVQRTMRDIEAKIPVLLAHVDLGPRHELYRYLDHDATIDAVRRLPELDFLARRSVHDAVTAAMWLSGAEVRERL